MRAQSLFAALSISAALGRARGIRNVVYYDDYRAFAPSRTDQETAARKGFTHVILSFAHPEIFLNGTSAEKPPFETPARLRAQFAEDAHFGLAIGGWGWLDGFAEAADAANRLRFATSVKAYLDTHGFDFVDIDWEYPGAQRLGKQQNLTKERADFPPFLRVLNETLGAAKYVTVAVGGKLSDDSTTAFATTGESGRPAADIAAHVAFFNLMAYDLTNRADTAAGHHTSVADSRAAVDRYIAWGYPAAQLNLGFALYAKHFRTAAAAANASCGGGGLGCPLERAQTPAGADTQTSGWLTFEWKNLADGAAVAPAGPGRAGACGLDIARQSRSACGAGHCCSREGFCGVGGPYCGAGCQPAFSGRPCHEDLDLRRSFAQARAGAVVDEERGAVSYWDRANRVFWTWETPEMITRKFGDIVTAQDLGGVFAWNLGQDTFDWQHLLLIKNKTDGVAKAPSSAPTQVDSQPSPIAAQVAAPTVYTAPAACSDRKS